MPQGQGQDQGLRLTKEVNSHLGVVNQKC